MAQSQHRHREQIPAWKVFVFGGKGFREGDDATSPGGTGGFMNKSKFLDDIKILVGGVVWTKRVNK